MTATMYSPGSRSLKVVVTSSFSKPSKSNVLSHLDIDDIEREPLLALIIYNQQILHGQALRDKIMN